MFSGTQQRWLVLVAIAALAAIAIACGTDETKLVSDDGNGGVGAQPTIPANEQPADQDEPILDRGYDVVDALAPIESVRILVLESYPEQYVVQIVSGLPSGCALFGHTEVIQEGTDIRISVYNSVPDPDALAAISCAAIYGMHDENVTLGSDFERGTTYSVYVNDYPVETFTTGSAPLQSLPPYEEDGFVVEPAPAEGLEIIIGEDSRGPVTYYAHVMWGLKNGCMESIGPNLVQSSQSVFDIYPLAKAPSGDVMCTEQYRIDSAQVELGVVGEGLVSCAVYTVNYGDESTTFQAIAPNVRCANPDAATPTPSPLPPDGGSSIIADSLALELSLKNQGADVANGGLFEGAEQFGLLPSELKVNGQRVLIYEFAPGSAAREAADTVSTDGSSFKMPDGSIMSVGWIATPHFYLFGNSIIVYVGNDEEMDVLLDSVATQFAGGNFDPGDVIDREDVDAGEEDAGEFVTKQAMIEQVQIASTRSIPAQHVVGITIALGGSCEEFNSTDWFVEGREVHIAVNTQVPTAPMPCTLAIIYEDVSVSIGSDFEAGVEYDVIVNGERQGSFFGG